MPMSPDYIRKLEQYLKDNLGPEAANMQFSLGQVRNAFGQPTGSFESMNGISGALQHNPNGFGSAGGRNVFDFNLRHDEETGEFFLNGNHVLTSAYQDDGLRLVAQKMAAAYKHTLAQYPTGQIDTSNARQWLADEMQAYSGSYVDPATASTPAARAKIASERFFGREFNPGTFKDDNGPFQINGQHYFSRTMGMHGPSIEAMFPSLEGSMWERDASGQLQFVNPKFKDDSDYATKFVKHVQKRGPGDIGRLIDPATGMELPNSESHGYRTDPLTGRIIRDQGYNLNYYVPVGGGGLGEGQIAQYRQIDFQIDRTVSLRGPTGSFAGLYDALPDSVTGRYMDVPALQRTTGQWDRMDIARDRMQIASGTVGDTAMIPVTMTIASGGSTAQGHSGIKGFNNPAFPGAFGAPAGVDYAMAANAIKDPIAWANANISGNLDYMMAHGYKLNEAVKYLGLDGIYNTDPTRGQFGYDQSAMSNYDVIRRAYQQTVTAPWNQTSNGGIIARMNTNIGRFGAWQWKQPGMPMEDMPKLASMDPAYYNRVAEYSAGKQDPYAEIMNSGVAQVRPNAQGFVAREGIEFSEGLASLLSGVGNTRSNPGLASARDMAGDLGSALDLMGLSRTAPILVSAKQLDANGNLTPVTLRLPSQRNLTWGQGMALGGPDDNNAAGTQQSRYALTEQATEYTSLATRILNAKMLGEVDPVDAKRWIEMSEKLSYSEGIVRHAEQMYLPNSTGGPVFADNAIARNQVAMGPKAIAAMFGIHPDDPDAARKLSAASEMLAGGKEAAYYALYPHLSQNKMTRLQVMPMSAIKGMSITDMPYGIGVNPELQGQLDKDFDVDAALVALAGRYQWNSETGSYAHISGGPGPMSVADLQRRQAEQIRVGLGNAEARKWAEDAAKYDTPEKLRNFMLNLMPENPRMISAGSIQSAGYVAEGQFKWDMGTTYNMARKFGAMSGFNETLTRLWEPYYQAMLDKTPLTDPAAQGYSVLKSFQAGTGGFVSGTDDEGNAILGRFGGGELGRNKAMSFILQNMFGPGGITDDAKFDPRLIRELFPNADPAMLALYDKIMAKAPGMGQSAATNLLFGSKPYESATSIGGPLIPLKAMIAARWRQKNVAGFLVGNAPSDEDTAYGEMGSAAGSLVDIMSAKFNSQQEMLDAFHNALVPDGPGSEGGLPLGTYLGDVYERMGFMNAGKGGKTPGWRSLSGFSNYLGFNVQGQGAEKYSNPAIGPGGYQDARIQPEEAKLLRGLESIGRANPQQAKELSDWIGSHAAPGWAGGVHIYQNPAIGGTPPGQPDPNGVLDLMRQMASIAMNAQAQMGDERIRRIYNMDAGPAFDIQNAISDVSRGQFVNMARLEKSTGLRQENEIMDAISRAQTGMQQGVNANQIGTFKGAVAQLASYSLNSATRYGNQDFRNTLGLLGGQFHQSSLDSFENLAALLDATNGATPEQFKQGIAYSGGAYSFGGNGPAAPRDARAVELTDRAFEGLNKTLDVLTPKIAELNKAHGVMAEKLQDQIRPLEAVKDKYLSTLSQISGMESVAERLSGGDAGRYQQVMQAQYLNRSADLSGAESDFDAETGQPKGVFSRIGQGLRNISEGRGPVGKFLRGGQLLSGMQMFYLSRMDRMFIEPALDASMQGAQDEMIRSSILGQAGYSISAPGTSMQAAAAYNIMGNEFQRQAAATWSPAVRDASNFLSGGGGGFASIGTATIGATLIGGYAGGMLTGGNPLGVLAGAGIAGGVTLYKGIESRNAYLRENPAFADMDAYAAYQGRQQTPDQRLGNAAAVRPGMIANLMDQGMTRDQAEVEADRRIGAALGDVKSIPMAASEAHGAMMQGVADRGLLRSEMLGLTPEERSQVLYAGNKRLSRNGLTDQMNQAIISQNQDYYGGGLAGEAMLQKAAFAGINLDLGTSAMAGLLGGSYAGYAGSFESYMQAGNRIGYNTAVAGLSSPYYAAMAQAGGDFRNGAQGAESFQGLAPALKAMMTELMKGQAGLSMGANMAGLAGPGNTLRLDNLMRQGPAGMRAAQDIMQAQQQQYSPAMLTYNSMIGAGAGFGMASQYANQAMGLNYQSVGAALGVYNQALSQGVSQSDAGMMFAGAGGGGAGFSNLWMNAMGGNGNALSLVGAMTGDNSAITRETGFYMSGGQRIAAGNAGLPLYTSTLARGNMSAVQNAQRIFGVEKYNSLSPALQEAVQGGIWGLQDYADSVSSGGGGGSAIARANAMRDYAFTTGEGLAGYNNLSGQPLTEGQGQWYLEDQRTAASRAQQRAQMGWGLESNALSVQQFNETWDFNRANALRSRDWQIEDFATQQQGRSMQRTWTTEDWSFNKNVAERNYGWQMEDFDTNIRRSSGFARKQLVKEKERATEAHDSDTTHESVVEQRQKQLWKMEDDQFEKQKKRSADMFNTTIQQMDIEKRHFMERIALDNSHHGAQLAWFDEQNKLEDAQKELTRSKYKLDHEAQLEALNQSGGISKKQQEIRDLMKDINKEQEIQNGKVKFKIDTEGKFYDEMPERFRKMKEAWDALTGGKTTGPGSEPAHPGGGGAAGGYQGLMYPGQKLDVAEFGPEWVTVHPHGSSLPAFNNSNSGNAGYGDVQVLVFLDSEPISAKVVQQQGKKLHRDRKR